MSKITKMEQAVQYLKDRGAREITSTSTKYRKFQFSNRPEVFYWVGKNGAVRCGRTVNASFSLTDLIFQSEPETQ